MPGHCSMILAALGETEINPPKFGILGSQSPLLTPRSALALNLLPEQQGSCNPAADLKLYPRIKKKNNKKKKIPFFPTQAEDAGADLQPLRGGRASIADRGALFPLACWLLSGGRGMLAASRQGWGCSPKKPKPGGDTEPGAGG